MLTFLPFNNDDTESCLTLFDKNCPAYFAVNERQDYLGFLNNTIPS